MNNRWREALAAISIIMFMAALGCGAGAYVVYSKANGDLFDVAANLPAIWTMASIGGILIVGAFLSMLAWLAVSAMVAEHRKDREHTARLPLGRQ